MDTNREALFSESKGSEAWYENLLSDIEINSTLIHDKEDGNSGMNQLDRTLDLDEGAMAEFEKSLGICPGTFMAGVYGYLLSCFSGAEEALYGFASSVGFSDAGKESGTPFKTVPVIEHFEIKESIGEHLSRLDEQIKGSLENDSLSFSDIVKKFDLSIPTLFIYHGETGDLAGIPEGTCNEKEEIIAEVFLRDGVFSLHISWRKDLFERESIEIFAASFEKAAKEFLCAPTYGEADITTKEQLSALDSFIGDPAKASLAEDIVTMFRSNAKKRPEATALILEDGKRSYAQIDEVSDRIAFALKQKGIGQGKVVSVMIHRNEYMVTASLGVLKSGAGYQPLDPSYPPDRLLFMVQDAKAALVITERDLASRIDGWGGEFLFTEDIPSLSPLPEGEALPVPEEHDIFTLLYTSGSTGVPKGVILEHGNLANFCRCYSEFFGVNEDTVHAAYASYGFDANMMDMWPTLTAGGCVCVIPEELRLNLLELGRYMAENNVNIAFITTQVGRQFAMSPYRPSCLRVLSVGGEKLAPMAPPEGIDFYNIYGPTECTIFATYKRIDREYLRIPIGQSFAGAALYVVDKNGRRVPPCVPGELWIAGPGVARSYLNRPEKSSESFTQNPFCELKGYDRVYHTGDVVRFLPNGEIDFIGRNDGQVKVRGFRIELTEVESVIREFPDINDTTVQTFEDKATGEKRIVAYIVSDKKIDINELNGFIGERKPYYMIPAVTMQIESVPLNQNGKVNRRALPEPVYSSDENNGAEEENIVDNPLEEELRKVICEITGNARLMRSLPMEQAGLTSIGVIRLSAYVFDRFGVNIPQKAFRGMSFIDLENKILLAWMDGKSEKKIPDNKSKEEDLAPFPLSAAQMGVYVECVKQPHSTAYNLPMSIEFRPETDPQAIADAIRAVLKAHPSINIHFDTVDSQVMVIRNESDEVDIPILEMDEEECKKYEKEYSVAFRLNRGPLFSFSIVRTDRAVYLFMDFHHLIFDGFSLDLFLGDLGTQLDGRKCREEKASYKTFVEDQIEFLEGEGAAEYEKYFDGIFEKYESPSRIAPDMPKSDSEGKSGLVHRVLSQKTVDEAVRRTGVSEAAFFLAVVYYVTARLTNSDCVYLSTISSGRSDVRFSSTYGMFVNTIPLFSELGRGTVDEFVSKTAKDFELAIAHEYYPFAKIAAKWEYSVELMYAYQRGIVNQQAIPGMVSMNDTDLNNLKFPLFIRIVDSGIAPAVEIQYDDSLYSAELADRIVRYCLTVIERFAKDGTAPVRSISLLDEEEMRLLEGFHTEPEEKDIPEDTFFYSGLERSAREYPDRTALIATDGSFTYRELDTTTDRVANALIKRGAKAGGSVLILLPRTSRALFAIFGASKAGLGYIPFDPTYPVDRINLVIEDSDPQFVITTADMLPRFEGKNAVDIEELLKETDCTKPHPALSLDDISYMIYTSGSTGRPKGVMLTQRAMVHYVADMPGREMIKIIRDCGNVFCSITTLSFDVSVFEYSVTLAHGLTLVFANEAQCNNADLLAERMLETKADIISGTPSRIYTFLSSEKFCEALRTNGKIVICGGEKYTEKLQLALRDLVPHQINLYGPSEITISSNEHDLTKDDVITIGRPSPGVVEYIVDTDGNELPIGMVGELYIGGWGVGRGYKNLPEMTAERFIKYKGGMIYKSGDFARWMKNGYIEILGRKDNQIKLRGLRIELGEVETVLASQPGMKYTAVKIEKINGIEHLCAWFTNEKKVDIRALKEAMGRTLTHYMVPTAYMQMEKMPFTPNGKLDLKSLPVPEVYRGEGDGARTKAETDFCQIFSTLLHVDNVLATESFFDLGGTSLLVTQVVIEAGKRGYTIVFGDVFTNPTPRALASLFEKKDESDSALVDKEIEDYDYSAIDDLLKKNTLDSFLDGEACELGDVLLTGASGYLGMHILHELLESTDSRIYCLIRGGQRGAETRLKELLMYYFESPCRELFGDRIIPLEGDVTDRDKVMSLKELPISTVINCAASVKHFAADSGIEVINVGGAKNIIDLCLATGALMIQTSTTSVVEIGYKDSLDENYHPTEQTLYFGQDLTNKYCRSKFLAERAVLEAIVSKGLKAKIMRYGNLSARHSDGEFQINFESNSAMGSLRAYAMLGCASYDQLDDVMEFSPIDMVAEATIKLAHTPKDCVLFHVLTDQYVQMVHVFNEMKAMGHAISYRERSDFDEAFAKAQSDPGKATMLTSLMAYSYGAGERERKTLIMDREYTLQVLYRLGFTWPLTSWDFFRRFMGVLNGLGYFDEDFEE